VTSVNLNPLGVNAVLRNWSWCFIPLLIWKQLHRIIVTRFTINRVFRLIFACPMKASLCFLHRPLKDMLHRGDRAMIYVFIAASYFPWLTIQPFPLTGWTAELWWIVWVLASLGILYQQLFHERYKCLETFFYLFMGIVPSVAIINMVCTHTFCYCW
jgi:monocyte-to-macrophage differentiation protein